MMDLAQMVGARRGMILKLTLADMTDKGLMITLNKRKRTEAVRRQLIRWNDDLRAVIDKALALRAKVPAADKRKWTTSTPPRYSSTGRARFSAKPRSTQPGSAPPAPPASASTSCTSTT
jgi:hypothetical protein